eukprot:15323888-Ditylum_brightwellii.AAC.1
MKSNLLCDRHVTDLLDEKFDQYNTTLLGDPLGSSKESDTMRYTGHYLSNIQNIKFYKESKIRQVNFTTLDDLGSDND